MFLPLRKLIPATLILVSLSLPNPSAVAQDESDDLAALRQQLAKLQAKFDDAESESLKPAARVRAVGAQQRRVPETPIRSPMLIRLYDVSDLFAVAPNYPAVFPEPAVSESPGHTLGLSGPRRHLNRGSSTMNTSSGLGGGLGGGGFGGGGGVFNIPPTSPAAATLGFPQKPATTSMQAAQVSLRQLVATIKGTVEPESWGTGVEDARVEFLGNTLLITATESMHQQIQQLLDLFREHWGRRKTVAVQTFFIRASADEITSLMDKKSNKVGAGVVDSDKWESFQSKAAQSGNIEYATALTGHNNQTLHAVSGRQRTFVVDAVPFERTVAGKSSRRGGNPDIDPDDELGELNEIDFDDYVRTRRIVGFSPVRQSFHDGFAVQITPMATRGGNFVILDLNAILNEFVQPTEEQDKPVVFVDQQDGNRMEVELDRAEYMAYRLSSTIRCPKNETVLVGGMTHSGPGEADGKELYVFVKTAVHTIQEDESDWSQEVPEAEK